jgi:hypothetical protein
MRQFVDLVRHGNDRELRAHERDHLAGVQVAEVPRDPKWGDVDEDPPVGHGIERTWSALAVERSRGRGVEPIAWSSRLGAEPGAACSGPLVTQASPGLHEHVTKNLLRFLKSLGNVNGKWE